MALPSSHASLKKTKTEKKKKKTSRKEAYSMLRVQWAGRCPSATARSTAGGTQGCLDLEHDPALMHIIEERSKRTPNYNGASPSPQNMGNSISH